ncbi:MAG: hypothetical protein P8R54_21660 [Myxococcota bacterium]|nr:hypothetical protein [Myxococcota bacterium]
MLKLPDWSSVQHGLALLEATEDAELWAHVRQGVSIQGGRLCIEAGYLKRTVQASHLANAALFFAARDPSAAKCDTLNLSDHPDLSDLSDLSRLTGLVHLNALFTKVYDFSALRGLPFLTTLRIGGELHWSQRRSSPLDLSFLSSLTALTRIDILDCTTLQALAPLKGLTTLTHLDISGCTAVTDLSPLSSLVALTSLNLMGCTAVTDLSPLKGLTALATLSCWGSGVPIAPELVQPRDRLGVPIYVGAQVLYANDLHRVTEVITHNKDKSRRAQPKIVLDSHQGVQLLSDLVVVSMVGQLTTSTQTVAAMLEGKFINSADVAQRDPTPDVQLLPKQQAQLEAARRRERTTLDLRGANLQDLSILSDLTHLTALNLGKCLFLTDVSALEKLTALEELRLSNCKSLKSLALKNLTKLHTLSITGCKSLKSLSLSGCHALKAITGLNPTLTKLNALTITHCSGFETLELKQKNLRDLTLEDLANLTMLSLISCGICSLRRLSRLPRLTHLTICDMHILSGPQQPSALSTITMKEANYVYDLRWLSALHSLTTLEIAGIGYPGNRALSDLSPLQGMPNLTSLSLISCLKVSSLRALHGLPKLEKLWLRGCDSVPHKSISDLLDTLPKNCTITKL